MGCCCGRPPFVRDDNLAKLASLNDFPERKKEKEKEDKKEEEEKKEDDMLQRKVAADLIFTVDSRRFYVHCWQVDQPIAVIFIIHGFGEHIRRYDQLAQLCNDQNYSVFSMDLTGHGRSDGIRAYIEDFRPLISDYIDFVLAIESRLFLKPLPVFLIGHSMGGLVASNIALATTGYLKEYANAAKLWPWNGVILSAPAFAPSPENATPCMKCMLPCISGSCPFFGPLALDARYVNSDPGEVTKYKNDPLIYHGAVRAGFANRFMTLMEDTKVRVKDVHFPFLLLQGGKERLVGPDGMTYFFTNASSADKTLRKFDDLCHELFFEPKNQQLLELFFAWIKQHLK